MKKFLKILLYYALIPFLSCLPGLFLSLSGQLAVSLISVPVLSAAICLLFRKKIDLKFAAKTNGFAAVILLLIFTVMMLIASGAVEGVLMTNFCWAIFPFAPVMLVSMLMDRLAFLYMTAFATYVICFLVTSLLGKVRPKKSLLAAALALSLICVTVSTALYMNRPSVKYGGHGFRYMHGYSSTDFTDYTVYSPDSKLVAPDSEVTLRIDNEEDMPVLDGAEACYPLYAAFAKACYTDIDAIEKKWLKETDDPRTNGKIVTFTNTVVGFDRLLRGAEDTEKFGGGIDMFFGARPSVSQLQMAEDLGVELTVTPIGREAFVFFTEPDNPVSGITSEQLKAIYHGDITNWKELGGKNQEILAFQRPKNSGSQTMMEYFMGDVTLKAPETYETVDAMAGVISEVAQYADEKGAMGYSFRYFVEELNQEKDVKLLSVDGVYPSPENIENGTYPLTADVCLVTRKNDPDPYVRKMTEFILSDAGQEIIRKTGYAGLPD